MKRSGLHQKFALSAFCLMTTTVYAGMPLWSFTPNGSPVVMISDAGTATVSYTVTNKSKKPRRLILSSKTPTGISQVGGPCVLDAKGPLNPKPTCTLNLKIKGSALPANHLLGGPSLCETNSNGTPNLNLCYQPNSGDVLDIRRFPVPGATTLNSSISSPSLLALSVNKPSTNPALTGKARKITITNTGSESAVDLAITYPIWPAGTPATTASSTCGSILAAGSSCTITVTPGANPTSNCNTGTVPTPGLITLTSTNVASALTSNVVVLGYGCQYQGGFLYAVDDTTANTGSIGGKVITLLNQAESFIGGPEPTSTVWSSSGVSHTTVSASVILGIDNTSTTVAPSPTSPAYPMGTPAYTPCNGLTDGACNSSNIVSYYNFNRVSGGSAPTPASYYAAGLCTATINTYSDWYLPAICEVDAVYGTAACPAGMQSIVPNLEFLISNAFGGSPTTACSPPAGAKCLAGFYWTSTENSANQLNGAWVEFFNTHASTQGRTSKSYALGVRCSRALTF